MESFIVYKLNETSYLQDVKKLPLYGPYAAALSYIIGYSNKVDDGPLFVYRGMSLSLKDLEKY